MSLSYSLEWVHMISYSNKVFVVQQYPIMSLTTMEYVCRTSMEYRKFGLNQTFLI
jgi:hypothetical protein